MRKNRFKISEELKEKFQNLQNEGLVDIKFMANSGESIDNTPEHFAKFFEEVLELRERKTETIEDLLRSIDVA